MSYETRKKKRPTLQVAAVRGCQERHSNSLNALWSDSIHPESRGSVHLHHCTVLTKMASAKQLSGR